MMMKELKPESWEHEARYNDFQSLDIRHTLFAFGLAVTMGKRLA